MLELPGNLCKSSTYYESQDLQLSSLSFRNRVNLLFQSSWFANGRGLDGEFFFYLTVATFLLTVESNLLTVHLGVS